MHNIEPKPEPLKGRELHDINEVTLLPPGQLRAVAGLIGGDKARTYVQASEIAGISLGTMYTHLRRIRENHPRLYEAIRTARKYQLKARHRTAVSNARSHSRQYFRNVRKGEQRWLRLALGL